MAAKAKKASERVPKRKPGTDRDAVRQLLEQPYSRAFVPDPSGGFSASIAEFPGCVSQGETVEEAYRNLEEAASNWLSSALAQGLPIPPPNETRSQPSGKFHLRMPRKLHAQVVELAEQDDVSVNQFIVSALSQHIGLHLGMTYAFPRVSFQWRTGLGISDFIVGGAAPVGFSPTNAVYGGTGKTARLIQGVHAALMKLHGPLAMDTNAPATAKPTGQLMASLEDRTN